MQIKNINLNYFRNYKDQKIELIKGINLFVGNNAEGKTNIIESVYMCALGKSYRATKDIEAINFYSNYCKVNIEYLKNNINNTIELYIDNTGKKIIKKNDIKTIKLIDHIGEVPIVIFSPDSLDIVKGAPGKRRKFIDMICSQLSKSYLISLQEYNKLLKIKNSLLKQDEFDFEYMNIVNEKMSEYIEKIVIYREEVIKKLNLKAKIIEKNITNSKEDIQINYITDFNGLNKLQINDILNKYLKIERIKKSTLKGIQRDDIEILVNNMEVSKFGSQGQNRTALLTLKLSDFEVLMEEKEEEPILLLDDIMSELDSSRISFLLKYIEKYQSIITTTDSSFIKNIENIKISKVFKGTLEN